MLEILTAFFAAAAWTGTLVLLWLFHRQIQGFPVLYRYVRLKFAAWTVLIVLQSLSYAAAETALLPRWMTEAGFTTLRIIGFCSIMAYATWRLIRELLTPHTIVAAVQPAAHVRMDTAGRLVGWNAAAEQLFGWTAADVLGQEVAAFLVPENMREQHRAGLERYRLTGEAPLVDSRYTQLALRQDGSSILVDISLTAHVSSRGTIFLGTCVPARIL